MACPSDYTHRVTRHIGSLVPHAQIILKFLHVTHVAIKDSKKAVLQNRLARKSFKGRVSLQALAFRIFRRPPVMKQGLQAPDNPLPQRVQGTLSSDTLSEKRRSKGGPASRLG